MQQQSTASSVHERRIHRILEEATERFNHELMDDEERMVLLDRIKRLRRAVETGAATVDAVHCGLERL
jgi:anti-sigma28 factor (negative regulator of flagellin synthesis)